MARERRCTSRPAAGGGNGAALALGDAHGELGERLERARDGAADEIRGGGGGEPEDDAHGEDEGRHVGERAANGDGLLDDAHGTHRLAVREDRRGREDRARLAGREAACVHGGARGIEQREASLGAIAPPAAGRGVFAAHLLQADGAHLELAADERGDGLGLFARGALGDQRGARLEAIEHEHAEAEGEGADDARQREEELHADAEAAGAGAHQARGDEGDEEDQRDRDAGRDEQARHARSLPASLGAGRSVTR
jgi:hypothetical protein